jgi:hypothetical protein
MRSGTPGPNQPAWPIAVDRVLVDGAATYVQFHRLTLTIPAFELNTKPGRFSTMHGPWHLSFVAP